MSRTYRRSLIKLDCNCGASVSGEWWEPNSEIETINEIKKAIREGRSPTRVCQCWTNGAYDYYSKRNLKRDRKSWDKSPKSFKKMKQKIRRAKERNSMARRDYDNIPIFKNENDWNWT